MFMCPRFFQWAVMYDVSGIKGADVEKGIKADWEHLVNKTERLQAAASSLTLFGTVIQINEKGILDSPMYLKDQGKPVIGIWGASGSFTL